MSVVVTGNIDVAVNEVQARKILNEIVMAIVTVRRVIIKVICPFHTVD